MSASDTISYLGPAGTFTEMALRLAPEAEGKVWKPVANVLEALMEVQTGTSFAAMIAIENSIEGGVTASQDALATMEGLRIVGEYVVPVRFSLAVRSGVTLDDVHTVAAHPVAYGQCRRWLHRTLPGHGHVAASSNVASAEVLLDRPDLIDAAVTPVNIRERFDLEVLADDIQDNAQARTRFALVTTRTDVPARTGHDKTSLIVELPEERPGGLMTMLEQFATRGINLSMITSRPIPEQPGRYRFVVDLDGHLHDARVADALLGLRRYSPSVKFLGSYPRAAASRVDEDPAASDANYAEAQRWFDTLDSAR
ncbi:prephenate dehydratase [Gulosibacter sediminis]|uniref:prephenate dehydratase n=1 Tax=Gulosibacter sediminis TaxID=1729695 RepID=UPI0024AD1620|nr:prephenate dehydratase [Gulosibacter sediminis]